MICQRCNKQQGIFKVKNKKTNQEQTICEWCEIPGDELVNSIEKSVEEKPIEPKTTTTYGRLHLVNKTKKIAKCRVCNQEIPAGSSCYNQSVKSESSIFPIATKVCENCAKELIKSGTQVA